MAKAYCGMFVEEQQTNDGRTRIDHVMRSAGARDATTTHFPTRECVQVARLCPCASVCLSVGVCVCVLASTCVCVRLRASRVLSYACMCAPPAAYLQAVMVNGAGAVV